MIAKVKLVVLVALLWPVFSLAALCAIPLFPLSLLCLQFDYAGYLMQSKDRLLAALLGWNGRKTVSRECGEQLLSKVERPCTFCSLVCKALDWFDPGHCKREGSRV